MPDPKLDRFVEAVREVARTSRYGPRERALAKYGFLFISVSFALSTTLPAEVLGLPTTPLVWIVRAGGGFLLIWAGRLIWKKAVAPVPEGKPKPPAIKGPAPFGPHDAKLFARLGRKDDLDRLRSWILDDQKPLVALMGESGVGKTSLLRAGLENHLKEDAVQVIYWEALPTGPEEGLLHAVQSHWGEPATAPASFARLASAVARGKRVVVIDQAEQLSPDRHPGIFELLRQVATANPPYVATWVVAFRREYSSVWRDFELDLPEPARRRLETLSLRRFLPEQAERVIAVLAEEGGLPIEQKVVKALVESIQFDGRVTPADIGISLLVLSEITSDGKDSAFTVEDFREHGGQAGLLTRYLERLLEQFPEPERREILHGLLSLVNLEDEQRLAEGRTPQELEKSARPTSPPHFAAVLRFLASGKARVLEEVPEPPFRYRLIHERLIPAIRQLSGVSLAEAEQASLLLERAYSVWSRERKARYLLSGRELRLAQRFRNQLVWGKNAEQKREYLRVSRRRRDRMWASAGIIFMVIAVFINYFETQRQLAADRALASSYGLPSDLIDYLDQLEHLTLPNGVMQLAWLNRANRLKSLDLGDATPASIKELPKDLRELKIGFLRGLQFPQLPSSLFSLDLGGQFFLRELRNLPPNLHSFTLRSRLIFYEGQDPVTIQLPRGLTNLNLLHTQPDSKPLEVETLNLSYLKDLQHISIWNTGGTLTIKSLDLPERVRSLTLGNVNIDWRDLPAKLEMLSCSCDPPAALMPETLKLLELRYPTSLRATDLPLKSLHIRDAQLSEIPLENLTSLTSLTLFVTERLPLLPPNLRELRLIPVAGSKLQGELPINLRRLEIVGLTSELPELPETLMSLTYTGQLSGPLPEYLRELTIRLAHEDRHYLASLRLRALNRLKLYGRIRVVPRDLDSLEELDISGTYITALDGVPPNLISLTLNQGQIESLNGLPGSVSSLNFINVWNQPE